MPYTAAWCCTLSRSIAQRGHLDAKREHRGYAAVKEHVFDDAVCVLRYTVAAEGYARRGHPDAKRDRRVISTMIEKHGGMHKGCAGVC